MNLKLPRDWEILLQDFLISTKWKEIERKVLDIYSTEKIFPEFKNLFKAFEICPFNKVSVVVIGQDPYHGENQANGLCFSTCGNAPPSLNNILKEIKSDVNKTAKNDLSYLGEQGVLLLNSILTVKKGEPLSCSFVGWEEFTDYVIKSISLKKESVVFLLWGKYAREKKCLIDKEKHLILEAPHPSPFSAHTGFLGCKHFSKTNNYLSLNGKEKIDW